MRFDEYIIKNNYGNISHGKFSNLTTLGCGGSIEYLYYPNNIKNLAKVFKFICDNNLKYFILGNGSNVLASDNDYDGIVICMKNLEQYIIKQSDGYHISSSYPTIKLAYDLAEMNLGDLSFLGGIPGLIGGAIFNNSGAFGDSIGNYIKTVKYINTNGEIIEINNSLCSFSYRRSAFHYINGIIVECTLNLKKNDTKRLLLERKKIRQLIQPVDVRSMGSVFKNNPLISSWKIIDALGLRGFRIGDAAVSTKHSNFIINLGNAKSRDVLALIELIETRSKLEFGIKMVREIIVI